MAGLVVAVVEAEAEPLQHQGAQETRATDQATVVIMALIFPLAEAVELVVMPLSPLPLT